MTLLALPELRDCRRIFLHRHALPARIGVHDFEFAKDLLRVI